MFSSINKFAIVTLFISLVWLINGLFCKVLNLVPRHQQIVARILGERHATVFTKVIGVLEILMFIWVLSGIEPRTCALFQMILVGVMNIIEFVKAPDLLLFGRLNILVSCLFIILLYYHEFILPVIIV